MSPHTVDDHRAQPPPPELAQSAQAQGRDATASPRKPIVTQPSRRVTSATGLNREERL